jgi:chemotaxis protein methyltransferase CheR
VCSSDLLGQVLLPEILAEGEKTGQRKLRAWSAACSTGEEPYTMALTLADFFGQKPGWDVKILATDLDTDVLAFASRAAYPEERVAPVPKSLLGRYFTKVPGSHPPSYQVSEELRKMVTFRRFNLMQESFPIKIPLDLIFCRNVMIYFNMPDKIGLLKKFHALLKPGAPIFVGHSESLMMVKDLFRYVQSTIYKKI